MDIQRILAAADHTLLAPDATWARIKAVCDEGIAYGTASVCIPPRFVADAAAYAAGRVTICTVVGFPHGNHTTAVKCFEAAEAAGSGAGEVDMVINLGWVKEGSYAAVLEEICRVRETCPRQVLKVIIETCLLTREEKAALCRVVSDSGADYIKTSTGFAGGGATREDVALLRRLVSPRVKVKAAGGIASLEDAQAFLDLGADRLGTSRLVGLARAAGYRPHGQD